MTAPPHPPPRPDDSITNPVTGEVEHYVRERTRDSCRACGDQTQVAGTCRFCPSCGETTGCG